MFDINPFLSPRSNPNRPPVDEQQPPLQLVDKVRQDLEDAPLWPFSCYGIPSVNENLLNGDISMEEIMLESKRMKFLNQFPAFQQELFSNIQASLGKRNNLPNVVTGNNLPKALIDQQPFQQSSPFHNTQSQLMPSVQAPISSLNPFQPTIAPSFSQSTMAPTLSLPPNNVHVTPQSPFHVNVPFSTEFASFGQGQAFPGPLSGQLPPLTNIQRQAFAAPSFLPGNIPDIPPHL